jgi:hypothetical protein
MFVVIELCDEILIDYFQLANFEYCKLNFEQLVDQLIEYM